MPYRASGKPHYRIDTQHLRRFTQFDHFSRYPLADAFRISTFTLSRLFRNQIGIGFTEYVNTRRVTLAKQLLLTTDLPTKRIAEECGLPNYNYFLRLFKTLTGYSPTAFRHKEETGD